MGAKNVTVDRALNVICPLGCEGSDEIVAIMAHSDTVFPDMEPMPLRIEDGKIFSPGHRRRYRQCGDYADDCEVYSGKPYDPKGAVMFVVDSGEEGLGQSERLPADHGDYAGRSKRCWRCGNLLRG